MFNTGVFKMEKLIYEYKPYPLAFAGLWASTQLVGSFAVTSGYALLLATSFIGLQRYHYRYIDKKTRKKGRITKATSQLRLRKKQSRSKQAYIRID